MFRSLRDSLCRASAAWVAGLILCFAASALGAPPTDPQERAALVGHPTSLLIQPQAVALTGPRSYQQVVVTGRYADGSVRDLTALCDYACDKADLVNARDGYLTPRKNGAGALVVKTGGQTARAALTVKDFEKAQPVSFRREVIAALNVGGCNAGACHGTPSGKNGFKLTLRGFDPAADYLELTRDVLGRRTDRTNPGDSLMLQKALGRIPHEGGVRFAADSVPGLAVRGWLTEGLKDDPAQLSPLKSIQILPGARVLTEPCRRQQLSVQATFADGSVRDATRLTVYSSSDSSVATVDNTGLVEFRQAGEVAILCRYLMQLQTLRLTFLQPRPGFVWTNPPENNYVDHYAFAKLKMLSIPPSDVCSDAEFLRRATLDVCGVLPTADEVRAFLADHASDKRAKLVDRLLQRPEYADFWTLKWSDIFRSSRKAIQVKGVYVFQDWLRRHVVNNDGFDVIVKQLLTADGETFSNPPANYYRIARDPQNLAETTAQLFCGVRMQCAKCHNHPFERWTQDDYYSFAAFFARVGRKKDPEEPGAKARGGEIIYVARAGEVTQPRTQQVMKPKFMGGAEPIIPPNEDRREVLADWIASANNPFFAKSVVNRIWYHLNGKGIVDPVDDFRDSNPSANDELLDALAKDFIASKFDVKHMIKVIMTSRTYQLSAQATDFNRDDNKYFSHTVTKMLTAEQLLDAICTATEAPEKFPGVPAGSRAMQLPDGDPNSSFLKTFGQPARELACECERESDSNLAQALQLINGQTINQKLRLPTNRIGRLLAAKTSDLEILTNLYLSTVSRPPTTADMKAARGYVAKNPDKRKAWEDVQWALLNSKEFLFRH